MEEANINALLLSSRDNIVYFTGLPNIGWQLYPVSSLATIVPMDGEVTSIIPGSLYASATKNTWVKNQIWMPRYPEKFPNAPLTPIAAIKKVFKELNLTNSTIGMELGLHTRIGWTQNMFQEFKTTFPNITIIDATDLLWKLRMIKSKAEIEALKKACDATNEAFRVSFESLRPGMTERELGTIAYVTMTEQTGYRPSFVMIRSGPKKYDMVNCPPFDKEIEKGDILVLDLGATYKGYTCDFMRMACIGEPTREQKEYFDVQLSSQIAGVEAVGPGVKVNEVCGACVRVIDEMGFADKVTPVRGVGHGLGLSGGEPPSMSCSSDTILEPGMFITVEPIFTDKEAKIGSFAIEDNIVITKTGKKIFSTFPKELWVVE